MRLISFFVLILFFTAACSDRPHEIIEKCADSKTKLLMPESTQMKLFVLDLRGKLHYNPGKNSKGVYESFYIACENEFKENKITFNEKWQK